jgi:hypothetical protein
MKIYMMLAATALCLAGGAGAGEKPQGDASDQDPAQIGFEAQASGKVTSVSSIEMVGHTDQHTLIKLLGEDGETDVVDLGNSEELKANNMVPKEGQQMWVDGRVGKINDTMVLVAENISQSKMLKLTRHALREETKQNAEARGAGEATEAKTAAGDERSRDVKEKKVTVDAGMEARTVDGTVVHTRKMKIEGQPEEHMLVKLQTEGGIVIVDLGAVSKVPAVDLAEGKCLAASGVVGKLNERPLIIADSVGNLSAIEWPVASAQEVK